MSFRSSPPKELPSMHSNVFPHSTFNWVGLDGTQVLCHMTPGLLFSYCCLPSLILCMQWIHTLRKLQWETLIKG